MATSFEKFFDSCGLVLGAHTSGFRFRFSVSQFHKVRIETMLRVGTAHTGFPISVFPFPNFQVPKIKLGKLGNEYLVCEHLFADKASLLRVPT